jgi:hypothetical protein
MQSIAPEPAPMPAPDYRDAPPAPIYREPEPTPTLAAAIAEQPMAAPVQPIAPVAPVAAAEPTPQPEEPSAPARRGWWRRMTSGG